MGIHLTFHCLGSHVMDFTGYYFYTGYANRVNYHNIKWSSKELTVKNRVLP